MNERNSTEGRACCSSSCTCRQCHVTAGAVRHGQWCAGDSNLDVRRRRVRGLVPDIHDAASPHSIPAGRRLSCAAGAKLCRPTTCRRHQVVIHDCDGGADGAQGRQGRRDDVCRIRRLLDVVLRRQLRYGRLSVVPRRRESLHVVPMAWLHVVYRQSSHLHHFQPRIQADVHSHSHV